MMQVIIKVSRFIPELLFEWSVLLCIISTINECQFNSKFTKRSLMVKSRVMMMGLPNGCHFNLLFMVSIKNSKSHEECIWSGYLTPLLRWCHHRALIQSAFETKKAARQHQSAQKMGILSNCDLSQSQDKSWTQILVWPFRFWFIAFGILTSITFTRAAK